MFSVSLPKWLGAGQLSHRQMEFRDFRVVFAMASDIPVMRIQRPGPYRTHEPSAQFHLHFKSSTPSTPQTPRNLQSPCFFDSRSQARRIPNFQPCVPAVGFDRGPFLTTGPAWWRPPCRPVQGTEKRGVNTGHSEVENHGNTIGRGWARVWVAATRGTNPSRYLLFRGLALWVLDVSAAV